MDQPQPSNRISGYFPDKGAPSASDCSSYTDIFEEFFPIGPGLLAQGATSIGYATGDQIAQIQQAQQEILAKLDVIERQRVRIWTVPIQTLAPHPIEIIRPFFAVVRQEEDDLFEASFVDANINASGESEYDALQMLNDELALSLRLFEENENQLAEGPARQLQVLREFLRMK